MFLFHLIHTPEFSKMGHSHFIYILPAYQVRSLSRSTHPTYSPWSSFFLFPLSASIRPSRWTLLCFFFFFFFFTRDSFLFPLDLPSRSGLLSVISPSITRILTAQGQESAREFRGGTVIVTQIHLFFLLSYILKPVRLSTSSLFI